MREDLAEAVLPPYTKVDVFQVQFEWSGKSMPGKTRNGAAGAVFAIGPVKFLSAPHGASAAASPNATARDALAEAVGLVKASPHGSVTDLLASKNEKDRLRGVGLAASAKPPDVRALLAAAQDLEGGRARLAAIVALGPIAASDAAVASVLIRLASDEDTVVRRTAIEQWPHIGDAAAPAAIDLLAREDHVPDLLPQLVDLVLASPHAATLLAMPLAGDAAIRVLNGLAALRDEDLVRFAPHLSGFVDGLLATPTGASHGAAAVAVLARAGATSSLERLGADPRLSVASRLVALDALLRTDDLRREGVVLLIRLLADAGAPQGLLRGALARTAPASGVEADLLEPYLERLASDHRSAWIRDQAREKLALLRPDPAAPLVIQSAVYGLNGKDIDLTAILGLRVKDGKLVVRAWSDLAGDPVYGVNKELRIVYWVLGERRVTSLRDGQSITLP